MATGFSPVPPGLSVPATVSSLKVDDALKCGICLELFRDPRSLPCLHTFCLECIQRTLNDDNCSLKCPMCRAKHELGEKGPELLPVNQYAARELLSQRQQQQGEASRMRGCHSCGEELELVAWCEDCNGDICQTCLSQHKKMSALQQHRLIVDPEEIRSSTSMKKSVPVPVCPKHTGLELKYVCTSCLEMVCSECFMLAHKDHKYTTAEEAHQTMKTKMKDLNALVTSKRKEFRGHLTKLNKIESKAIKSTDHMKSMVDNAFDTINASVEAQRNEALQHVSQGVKDIWSQKELMEVSLAQLDSFTRFADCAKKCTSSTSYVSMAIQGIKLMGRLKDIHGDQKSLDHKFMVVGVKCPLDAVFGLGEPYCRLTPSPGRISYLGNKVTATLEVKGFPVLSSTLSDEYKLNATVEYDRAIVPAEVKRIVSQHVEWEIAFESINSYHTIFISYHTLVIQYDLTRENMPSIREKATYTW